MSDSENRKGRNPFATVLTYSPLLGAVGMGGLSVYNDIQANRALEGTTAADAAGRAARSIRGMRLAAKNAAGGVLDARQMLKKSLGGSFGPDSAKRLAFAYAAAIADPAVSLNKQNMLQALFEAQSMSKQALGPSGDRTAFASHMQGIISGMSKNDSNILWKKWQMLDPSKYIDTVGHSLQLGKTTAGATAIHWEQHGLSSFYQNMGFLGKGGELAVPDFFTSRRSIESFKGWKKKTGLGNVKAHMTLHELTGRDGSTFRELNVRYKGSRREFRFVFGEPLGPKGKRIPTGERVVSPKGMSIFSVGHVLNSNKSVNDQLAEQIVKMEGMSGKDRAQAYRGFYSDLRKIGQFETGHSTPGERLRSALARNTVFDEAALGEEHYTADMMESFMKKHPTMEAIAPGTLVKGGFIDMANFRTTPTGASHNLLDLFKDQHSFDRSVRLFQFMRDLNWSPTETAHAMWGKKDTSTLAGTSIGGLPTGSFSAPSANRRGRNPRHLDLRDTAHLKSVGMGPSDALRRFIPVNAGATYEKLIMKEFGYVTPSSISLHVLGDGIKKDGKAGQIPGILRSWGMRDGESFIRESFSKALRAQRTPSYDIIASPGSPVSLPLGEATLKKLAAGTLSPEEMAEAIRTRISETKGGISITRGQALGLGSGTKSGRVIRAAGESYVSETLVGATLSHEGYLRLHVRQDIDAIEGMKVFHGTKTSTKIRFDDVMTKNLAVIAEHMGMSVTEMGKLAKHIDQITNTSPLGKHLFAVHEQAISGLRIVAGQELENLQLKRAQHIANTQSAGTMLKAKIYNLQKKLGNKDPKLHKLLDNFLRARKVLGEISSQPVESFNIEKSNAAVANLQKIREQLAAHGGPASWKKDLAAARGELDQLVASHSESPQLMRLKQFLAQDQGHLYGTKDKGGILTAVAKKARDLGLGKSGLIGSVFGGAHYYYGKKGGEAAVTEFETMLTSIFKDSGHVAGLASHRVAIGSISNFIGDFPHLAQGRMGSVESRNFDMLLSKQIKIGGENLTEAIIRDIYGSTASATAVDDYNAISKMLWGITGDATQIDESLPRVKLASQSLADITQEDWFRGKGAVVEMPTEMHSALKARGMATSWPVPGMEAVSSELGEEIRTAGYARTQGGELQEKAYRNQVKKMFQLLAPDGYSSDLDLDTRLGRIMTGHEGSGMSGVVGLYQTAKRGLVKNKLGPGSSYAQAYGLPAISDILDNQMIGSREGINTRVGMDLADGNTAFISEKLGKRLVGEMDDAGILPANFKKEAFLRGESAWYGIVGRMPAAYQGSIQPSRIAVYTGGPSKEIENIKIAERLVDVKVNGKVERMNLGLAPGMGMDFDKDMAFVKLMTDSDGVRMMSGKGAMSEVARQYDYTQVWQSKVNEDVFDSMIDYGKKRGYSEEAVKDLRIQESKKLFYGKDVGRISKTLEEVKYAMLLENMGESQRSKIYAILSAVEETATLKSRHLPEAMNVGQELVHALYGKEGSSASQMDTGNFIGVMKKIFMGKGNIQSGYDIEIGGKTQKMAWNEADEKALMTTMANYQNEEGGIRRKVFNLSRTKRRMSLDHTLKAARHAIEHGMSGEDQLARLVSTVNRQSTMAGFAEEMLGKINLSTKELGKHKRTLGAAAMVGLAGTALMQGVMGGPGYGGAPLGDEAGLDPRLLQHVQDGSMLNMPASNVTPQGVAPQSAMGQRSGAVHTPTSRVTATGTTSRARVGANMQASEMDIAVSEYRRRRPNANIRTRINDNRRPLYPSAIDHY